MTSIIGFTPEMINEVRKCQADPVHFISTYCKVNHPAKGMTPIVLYPYQIDMIEAMKEGNTIILAPRQVGKTTIECLFALWYGLFHENKNLLIGSHNLNAARHMMSIIRHAYTEVPGWLKVKANEFNMASISFDNGCRIMTTAITANFGRGLSINYALLDEFAYVQEKNKQGLMNIIPCISSCNGKCIIASSYNPDDIEFKAIWDAAVKLKNGFNPLRIYWDEHPDRDQEFKDRMINILGEKSWKIEYECMFA